MIKNADGLINHPVWLGGPGVAGAFAQTISGRVKDNNPVTPGQMRHLHLPNTAVGDLPGRKQQNGRGRRIAKYLIANFKIV